MARGRRVVEARVAPDGDRVAVLSTRPRRADVRIDLAGVVRGGGGVPQRLADPLRLAATATRASSIAWLDDRTLATLAVIDGKTLQPAVITVGGDVRGLTPVRDPSPSPRPGRARPVGRDLGRPAARPGGSQWVDSGPATDLAVAAG